jgi:hypothetical protein
LDGLFAQLFHERMLTKRVIKNVLVKGLRHNQVVVSLILEALRHGYQTELIKPYKSYDMSFPFAYQYTLIFISCFLRCCCQYGYDPPAPLPGQLCYMWDNLCQGLLGPFPGPRGSRVTGRCESGAIAHRQAVII